MIGYHTSYDHNLVGMAMTQGRREDVVNIGIGIKEIVSPPGMTANDFAISLYHRVRVFHLVTDGDFMIVPITRHINPNPLFAFFLIWKMAPDKLFLEPVHTTYCQPFSEKKRIGKRRVCCTPTWQGRVVDEI